MMLDLPHRQVLDGYISTKIKKHIRHKKINKVNRFETKKTTCYLLSVTQLSVESFESLLFYSVFSLLRLISNSSHTLLVDDYLVCRIIPAQFYRAFFETQSGGN